MAPDSVSRTGRDALPEGEDEVLDAVADLGAALLAELREARLGRLDTDHPLVVGDVHEQGAVGVALAQHRVDLEAGMGGIGVVDAVAVVDDAFEHRGGQDTHRPYSERVTDHQLPPGVPSGGPDIVGDAEAAERHGLDLLRRTGEEIVTGVERALPGWAHAQAERIVDAWGHHEGDERREILDRARAAGEEAARRIAAELQDVIERDPDDHRVTPLQVVRTAYQEVTVVLREAGIPPVERDEFAERSFPDDDYGFAPDTLEDLGDEDLAPLHLAWGVAKATVHKARHQGP